MSKNTNTTQNIAYQKNIPLLLLDKLTNPLPLQCSQAYRAKTIILAQHIVLKSSQIQIALELPQSYEYPLLSL